MTATKTPAPRVGDVVQLSGSDERHVVIGLAGEVVRIGLEVKPASAPFYLAGEDSHQFLKASGYHLQSLVSGALSTRQRGELTVVAKRHRVSPALFEAAEAQQDVLVGVEL